MSAEPVVATRTPLRDFDVPGEGFWLENLMGNRFESGFRIGRYSSDLEELISISANLIISRTQMVIVMMTEKLNKQLNNAALIE